MNTVVKVEHLSKKYIIGHQRNAGGVGLRDLFSDKLDYFRRKIVNPFKEFARPVSPTEEFWALKDVSFEIKQGDRLGIIGRNGAGKSTLLKVLSRITEPTKGRVSIKGRVASLLEVGTGFHPELTGRENIYLNGAILGMSRFEIKRKFDEIVDFAETERFLDTPVKRYSSGMYVRLAFAVAAHLDPEILIVDEVLSVGDAVFQKKCLGRMEKVGKEGRTVLFVSHNMTAVSTLCRCGIVLTQGGATGLLSAEEAVSLYLNQDQEVSSSSVWNGASGDSQVKMYSLSVCGRDASTKLQTDMPIHVSFTLEVFSKVSGLVVGMHLLSEDGRELAFSAQYDDEVLGVPTELDPGIYNCQVCVPPNSLAQGTYRVIPDVGIHNIKRIVGDSVQVKFSVQNLHGLGRKLMTGKGLENVFRPQWKWSMGKK